MATEKMVVMFVGGWLHVSMSGLGLDDVSGGPVWLGDVSGGHVFVGWWLHVSMGGLGLDGVGGGHVWHCDVFGLWLGLCGLGLGLGLGCADDAVAG